LLEFRILGPLEVVRDGASLEFRGSRERALLALLVLNANRAVSAERLAEDLWGDALPDGAAGTLRAYLSRVRRGLGDAGGLIVTRGSGYLLQVEPGTIDAARFAALVAQGRWQAAEGDHRRAGETLREALALWRGPALADVADAPSARAEAASLEEARLAALEGRLEADMACGDHAELVGELESVTRAHPLRERFWQMRILALYRAGRQAEALRTYQELRRILGEELGIEPSPTLQRLETAVLRQDCELEWRPAPVAGQAVAASPGPPPGDEGFVGRVAELDRLHAAWAAARSGRCRLVLVAGDPGIGKSRVAAAFTRRREAGIVLFGRCDEEMGVPYQPFVEALGRYLREEPAPELGRFGGELVRLVPEVAERGLPPPLRSDPATERYRLFDAVVGWLSALSQRAPVVLVLDDLHWATRNTLLLLRHIIRSDEALPLLVVAAYRDSPLDVTSDLAGTLAELLPQPGVERVRLAGLDEAGVAAVMEARARHELDDEGRALAGLLHAQTAGNPFFLREMLHHLVEKGAIVHRDGRWVTAQPVGEVDVPDSVREVVGRRLGRLGDEARGVLALASVLGERFDLELLAVAGGQPEEPVLAALGPAVAARLVKETGAGAYQFAHALVRATLEDTLGPTRRAQLHRRVAVALEEVCADRLAEHYETLAHHYVEGRDWHKALDYLTKAGDKAAAAYANQEALEYYARGLEVAERLDDVAAVAALCRRRADVNMGTSRFGDAVDDLHRWVDAARRLGDLRLTGIALGYRGLAEIYQHDYELAEATLRESLAIATGEGAAEVRALGSMFLCFLYVVRDRHAEAQPLFRFVEDHADPLPDAFAQGFWAWFASRWHLWGGQVDAALRVSAESRPSARAVTFHRVAAEWNEAHALATSGKYEAALGLLHETLATCERIGDFVIRVRCLNTIGYVYGELGDAVQAMEWNQQSLDMAVAINAPVPEVEMNARLNLAENFLAQARIDDAGEQFRLVENIVRHPTPRQDWMRWRYAQRFLHGFGEWWLGRGDPARAVALAEECLAWAQRTASNKNVVKARRLRGQACLAQGRVEEAEKEIAAALQLAEEVGSPPQIWSTHAALGDVRRAQGRPEDARHEYRAALRLIQEVAARLTDQDLRATFLAADHVRVIAKAAGCGPGTDLEEATTL
jgi:DNA-binding SARP family transcriptional activator